MLPDVALHRPGSLDEAVRVLDWDHVGYAGGTELVPALRLGVRRPDALVDLKRIPELAGVEVAGDQLAVGALTTHRQLAATPDARRLVPLLADVVTRVGNVRVRSTGTIGGNLAFAEPRSDLATVCLALNASVEIAGPHGRRTITVDELIVGAYETSLAPDELIVRLIVAPQRQPDTRYWKLQPMERPALGVAIVPDGEQATVVVGAATERPVRSVLPLGADAAAAVDDFCAGIDLVGDLTGSAAYKRAVLAHHLRTELVTERAA
ncbi:MAG: FAD binding domain-containing protein [Acidimicrobiales bacterium]